VRPNAIGTYRWWNSLLSRISSGVQRRSTSGTIFVFKKWIAFASSGGVIMMPASFSTPSGSRSWIKVRDLIVVGAQDT
jgi:hypothetical protein